MNRIQAFYFMVFLLLPINAIQAQFIFPKTGAEFTAFKSECNFRAKLGIQYRHDFKVPSATVNNLAREFCERLVKFNPDGTPNEIEYFDESGRKRAIVIYQYSKAGIPQRETKFHPTGNIISRTDFRYDYKNRLLDKSEFDQFDYIVQKIVYRFNEKENTIRELEFSSPEMVTNMFVYSYSQLDTGKLINVEEYEGESRLKQTRKINYENDRIKSEAFFNALGQRQYSLEYMYDNENHLIKIIRVFGDKSQLDSHTYQYNERGLLIAETEFDLQGKLKKCYKYRYE